MAPATRLEPRRVVLVAVSLAAVGANALIAGEAVHRLPYLLTGLTVLFLMQTFWEDRQTAGSWLAVSTGTLLVALLVSISLSVAWSDPDAETQIASGIVEVNEAATAEAPTTLVTGTDVPTEVQGAVERREDAERLVVCEAALEQIAAAIRQSGGTVDAQIVPPTGNTSELDVARRLQSCDVRLRAIAATLPG